MLYEHMVFEAHENGGFLFDCRTGNSFTVNPTGAAVLMNLGDGTTEDELVDAILNEYEGSRDEVKHDVANFLAALRKAKVIG